MCAGKAHKSKQEIGLKSVDWLYLSIKNILKNIATLKSFLRSNNSTFTTINSSVFFTVTAEPVVEEAYCYNNQNQGGAE